MIKQKSHIVIDAYMLQLGLKGNELLIYALIAGFCQDGVSECWTSQETMAEWCGGISTRAVRDILQNLITKKLITKKECLNKNVKYSYKVVEIVPELSSNEQEVFSTKQEVFSTQQEVFSGSDRNFFPVVQELSSGNNKIDNIYDNKIYNKTIKEKEKEKEKEKDDPKPPLPDSGQADFVSFEEQRKKDYELAELTKKKIQADLIKKFGV